MEEIIGFLIILASIVISIISSMKKQSANNNEEVGAFPDNDGSQEQPANMERFNTVPKFTDEAEDEYRQKQYDRFEDEESEGTEIDERKENNEKVKEDISVTTSPRVETKSVKSKKKAKKQKHFLWQLKRDFNPKKAVIYSEIINRKYF